MTLIKTTPRLSFDQRGFKAGDIVACVSEGYSQYRLWGKPYILDNCPDGLGIKVWDGDLRQLVTLYGLFGEWKVVPPEPKHKGPFSAIILDRDGVEVGRQEDVKVEVDNEQYTLSL